MEKDEKPSKPLWKQKFALPKDNRLRQCLI